MSQSIKLDPDQRKQLMRRSDAKGLIQLSGHLAVLGMTGAGVWLSAGSAWMYLTLPVYGTVMVFLFAPLHETVHYTAFAHKWLNNAVAAVIGFLLVLPYQYFRAFHYGHHRYTQDPQRDPEAIGSKPQSVARWVLHVSGLPVWREHIVTLCRHAAGRIDEAEQFIEVHKHSAIILEARIHLAGYALVLWLSLMLSSTVIWWYWILPLLLGQPMLRLFLLAEHTDCDESDDMLANSRTTYTSPLMSFLCWNMCYHAEHHYLAAVPFHALPALHACTGTAVKHKGDGYWNVNRDIFLALPHRVNRP